MKRIIGVAILLNFAAAFAAQSALVRPTALPHVDGGVCTVTGRVCTIAQDRRTLGVLAHSALRDVIGPRAIAVSPNAIAPALIPTSISATISEVTTVGTPAVPALARRRPMAGFESPLEFGLFLSEREIENTLVQPVPPAAPIMLLGLAAIAGFVRRRL